MDNITRNRIILFLILVVVIAAISGLIYLFSMYRSSSVVMGENNTSTTTESIATNTPATTTTPVTDKEFVGKANVIEIFNVKPNDMVKTPLTIVGKAKLWYFEGSFPVEVVDANNNQVALGVATAQSDWMVTDFVDFKVTLTFATTTTATGIIIFKKDNPSGELKYDDSFSLPIRFSPSN